MLDKERDIAFRAGGPRAPLHVILQTDAGASRFRAAHVEAVRRCLLERQSEVQIRIFQHHLVSTQANASLVSDLVVGSPSLGGMRWTIGTSIRTWSSSHRLVGEG